MKKKILIVVGVILVLIAGLLIAPNLIDWNEYKPQVTGGFESATGNKIDIRGDLSFKLLPSPALSVSDVSLANTSWGTAENFLQLENLDIRLELFPLLNGDYKVTSLLLDGGIINLEKNADGIANWEELFASEGEDAGEASEITLENFLLRNTAINYADAGTETAYNVSDIDAEFVVTSLTGPVAGEGELTYLGSSLDFGFDVGRFEAGGQVPLNLSLVVDDDDPGIAFSGTLVSEEGVTALSGNLSGGGGNAANLIGFLSRAGGSEEAPSGPWQEDYSLNSTILAVLTEEKTEVDLEPLSLSLGETNVEGNIQAISTDTLETKINLKIDTLNLDAWMGDEEADDTEPAQIPEDLSGDFAVEIGTASYHGQNIQNAALKGKLEAGVFRIENLSASLPGETSANLSGTLTNGRNGINFQGPVHADTRSLRDVLDWLEIDVSEFPRNRLARLDFDGRINYADPLVEITNTRATLDSTRFNGNITTYLDDSNRFAISGSVNTLDLDSYYPSLLEEDEEGEALGLAGRMANLQESLITLTGYAGSIDLKAERLKMMGASVGNAAFKGTLSGDNATIETLSAEDFEGAALSLSGTINDIPGQLDMSVRTTVQSSSLLRLFQWAEIESPFDERVVPSANIQASLRGDLSETQFNLAGSLSDILFSFAGSARDLKTTPRLEADLSLSHPRMIEFVRKFTPDYFPARSPLGPIEIEARLEGIETNYTLSNLDADLGPAHFQGSLQVQDRNGRPFYGGNLSVRVLVMDDFMAEPQAGLEQATANGGERWSTDEWDLTFLRENDFDVILRADSLQFRTYRFLNPRVRLSAQNAVMTIENLNARLFDGTIEANGTMDGTDVPVLDLTMVLSDVSTERLLNSSAEIESLTGQSNFTGTFRAAGQNQKAMIETLTGTANLGSRDGVIKGINMPRLAERMQGLNNIQALAGLLGATLGGGETPYRFINTTADINSGIITFDQIESDIDATVLGGRGTINLPNWSQDITGGMRFKDYPGLPSIGISIRGRIDAPETKFDTDPLQAFKLEEFTTTLFEQILKTPEEETQDALPEGTQQPEGTAQPAQETVEPQAEPTPEEQILRGLFDLLGGGEEEEEPVEEEGGGQ